MISDFPAIVDACVLVQAAVRDTLLRLFERRLFLARWTDEIIEETVRTLRDKLGRTAEQTDRLVNELRAHFPDAWVEAGYRELIPLMTNQEKDRHVLAAAVKTPCEVIVTYNLKDFPEESLKPFGIEAMHPDEFLIDLYHINAELVVHVLHEQGAALREPRTIGQVLASLETCRCTKFAQLIREKLSL
jgi:PIN domain